MENNCVCFVDLVPACFDKEFVGASFNERISRKLGVDVQSCEAVVLDRSIGYGSGQGTVNLLPGLEGECLLE